MARAKNGLYGPLNGTVGNLVFYQLNGEQVVRVKRAALLKPSEGRMKEVQGDFSEVMKVVKAVSHFARVGFYDLAEGRMAFQKALSANLLRYRAAEDKEQLRWLLVSEGQRAGAKELMAGFTDDVSLAISWGAAMQDMEWSDDDLAMLMAINTRSLETSINLATFRRHHHSAILKLPPLQPGDTLQCFLSFHSPLSPDNTIKLENISESQSFELVFPI
ncbi:MAG: hypothetical protein GX587_04530 [Bacteroidales bacterium]|nr:hypothetical protein [Bacteroidales bacterium]